MSIKPHLNPFQLRGIDRIFLLRCLLRPHYSRTCMLSSGKRRCYHLSYGRDVQLLGVLHQGLFFGLLTSSRLSITVQYNQVGMN